MKAYTEMNSVFRLIIIDAVFYSSVTMFMISFYRSFIVIPISFLAKTLISERRAAVHAASYDAIFTHFDDPQTVHYLALALCYKKKSFAEKKLWFAAKFFMFIQNEVST